MTPLETIKTNKESSIGIFFLKDIWHQYTQAKPTNNNFQKVDWKYVNGVFNALGIGLEPTFQYLLSSKPSFEEFENWIRKNGVVSEKMITYFNSIISSKKNNELKFEEKVFTDVDIENFNRDGYIILKGAIPKEDCKIAVDFICEKIGADLSDSSTWYRPSPLRKGIMIQLFQSKILDKNRLAKKIRLAYEQLWEKKHLMVSMDRVSFNPPEKEDYHFQGPNLHWDVSLKRPIPFGLQGLLYLVDTKEDQGAFTLIPGFQNKIDSWLENLPKNVNPRDHKILNQFDAKPIAGEAGDFIIWNQCLPHGSSPNTSTFPRIVQYINYQPLDLGYQNEWI